MSRIGFGFDLHNTLLFSNDAWIEAYLRQTDESFRDVVTMAVYQKQNRKQIADRIGVDYQFVYAAYCESVRPDPVMIRLVTSLKRQYPIFLISSASGDRVQKDLQKWNGEQFFDHIYTKETFQKDNPRDWQKLVERQGLDLLVYIGNDAEEDASIHPQVISLISGSFLRRMDELNLLVRRGKTDAL